MRVYTRQLQPPCDMTIGQIVAKVVESKHKDFPENCIVLANVGWVKTGIFNVDALNTAQPGSLMRAPEMPPGASLSYLLGACGVPGIAAYFGLLEICQPNDGETVIVNGAAGAVGGLVGQIAKIKGCRVLGFAGTDEKCDLLITKYGFDKAYNYRKVSVKEALADGAPNGVDCFFDNIGGEDSAIIINSLNEYGRVSCCGAISNYNNVEEAKVPTTSENIVFKQLRIEGFTVIRWQARWMEAIQQLAQWIGEGKIKVEETIIEGYEKMPDAFIGLFKGSNVGKMIVKA